MSQIKSRNTKPELLVRRFLFSNGFRYNIHVKTLPGKPDIVFPKRKVVIFIHGCFWHGHEGCKYYVIPKTKTLWWLNKITRNRDLDHEHKTVLLGLGWNVVEIYECQLKKDTITETLLHLKESLCYKEDIFVDKT